MQFVDFNDEAIDCMSITQWRDLTKMEISRSQNTKFETAEESEVTIVCLSYDDGVRYEGNPKPCRAKKVLHKELINCHYASILYDANGFWVLNLNIENYAFPIDLAKFKTREDAIKAARLCRGVTNIVDAGKVIAKEFPEFGTEILYGVDHLKNTHGL